MAIIVEVQQVTDDFYRVVTHQIVEDETNPDCEALQRVEDESTAEAFRLMEVRDTLQVLLRQSKLRGAEQKTIELFLQGWDIPDIARLLGISRQCVRENYWRAIRRLRETAQRLGITEP